MAQSTGEALERAARILVKSVAITTLGGMLAGSVVFSIVAAGALCGAMLGALGRAEARRSRPD